MNNSNNHNQSSAELNSANSFYLPCNYTAWLQKVYVGVLNVPFGVGCRPHFMKLCPFGAGGAGSPSNTMWLGLRPTSLPSGILIHPGMSSKLGGCPPLGEGELGLYLTQCGLGRGLPPHQLHLDPTSRLATADMAENLGGGLCPFGEGSWVPI